jgi:hypothetical protein
MAIKLQFEPDYQKRVLCINFEDSVDIVGKSDVLKWRSQWMQALSSWHSPYSALLDLNNLQTVSEDEVVQKELQLMLKFFEGFFLKKAVGFRSETKPPIKLPFEIMTSEEQARAAVGLDRQARKREEGNFRDSIQFANDFRRHVIEVSFSYEAQIAGPEQWQDFKSKLSNNLMQWHSKWNFLINCENLEISELGQSGWNDFRRYFSGFFMKNTLGYNPRKDLKFPFQVYRSRHKAVAQLENEGAFSGNEAHCQSSTDSSTKD